MTVFQKSKNPFYVFVESDMGLSILPLHKALIVILTNYGKIVSKRKIVWTENN